LRKKIVISSRLLLHFSDTSSFLGLMGVKHGHSLLHLENIAKPFYNISYTATSPIWWQFGLDLQLFYVGPNQYRDRLQDCQQLSLSFALYPINKFMRFLNLIAN